MTPSSPKRISTSYGVKIMKIRAIENLTLFWAKYIAVLFLAVLEKERATCGPKNVKFE